MINLKTKLNDSKGITLIALVITIIVLLILAGISIAMLTGENGILTKAKTAQKETDEATAKEKVQVAVLGSYDKDGTLNFKELKDNLEKEEDISIIDGNDKFPITVSVDSQYVFVIDEKANISYKSNDSSEDKKIIISANDIINTEDKSQYYGATVTGYNCQNSNGVNAWKIFYAADEHIYLITDDYIHYNYCPSSSTQSIIRNSDYCLSMENVIKDYVGSVSITDLTIKNLNKNYFDYLTTNSITSTNNNMKSVAYMTDTNVWKVFAGDKAEYAIGGPSIELVLNSYNQKYNTEHEAKTTSVYGYLLRMSNTDNWEPYMPDMLPINDSLYRITSEEKAVGMWLSSPSTLYINNKSNSYPFNIASDGGVNYNGYDSIGFRPLVCLKSNVQLQKNLDGTYTIL